MSSVYLAGQISGLTFDGAQDWRDDAKRYLRTFDIEGISPLRGQEHLRESEGVLEGSHEYDVTTTARAVMHRDHYDCHKCDVLIANLMDTKRISAGTVMEIAWAYHAHKPVILIEGEGGIHQAHPMIAEAVTYRVDNLSEALRLTVALLEDYG